MPTLISSWGGHMSLHSSKVYCVMKSNFDKWYFFPSSFCLCFVHGSVQGSSFFCQFCVVLQLWLEAYITSNINHMKGYILRSNVMWESTNSTYFRHSHQLISTWIHFIDYTYFYRCKKYQSLGKLSLKNCQKNQKYQTELLPISLQGICCKTNFTTSLWNSNVLG